MPSRDDAVRLRQMLDAARQATKFAEGRERADLDSDLMFALATVRLLEIVGEAAKHVSEEFRRESVCHPLEGNRCDTRSLDSRIL